jgi:hypothetical protein
MNCLSYVFAFSCLKAAASRVAPANDKKILNQQIISSQSGAYPSCCFMSKKMITLNAKQVIICEAGYMRSRL